MKSVHRLFSELPRSMRAGLGLAGLGAVIDIGYHLATNDGGMGHGPVAFVGHLTTLIGMLVTMVGLFAVAFRRPPVQTTTTKGHQL